MVANTRLCVARRRKTFHNRSITFGGKVRKILPYHRDGAEGASVKVRTLKQLLSALPADFPVSIVLIVLYHQK